MKLTYFTFALIILTLGCTNIFTGDLVYNGLLLVDNCNSNLNSLNSIMETSRPANRIFGSSGTLSYSQYDSLSAADINNSPHDSVRI